MNDIFDDKSVAIKYGDLKTPKVVSKARGEYSSMLREQAKELNIPILRDPHLTSLLDDVDIDEEVPETLFEMVAIILSWAYWLRDKKPPED
jgi:type III secretion system FlhB-like substrate exporter